jgi:hypothetical protein
MKHYIVMGAMLMAMTGGLEAQELNEDQQTAKTIFENNLFDAQEKLQELKLGEGVMEWSWYREWTIEPLKKAIVEAQHAKVPPTTMIGFGKQVPFTEAVQQALKIEQEFKRAFQEKDDPAAIFRNGQTPANLKRYEAFKAQFTKGLSGDKLRIMNGILMQGVVYAQDPPKFFIGYYGEGKKLLTTPEAFAKAAVWATADYAYASDDTLKRDPHWRAEVHHFDGMKLVKTTNHRGPGKSAPEALFR